MIRLHPLIFAGKTGTHIRDLVRTMKDRWNRNWKDGQYLLPGTDATLFPIDFEPQPLLEVFSIVDVTICPRTRASSLDDLAYFYLVQFSDSTARWMRPNELDQDWIMLLLGYQSSIENQIRICQKAVEEAVITISNSFQ
jgi:hypothetical protein